jgi:hypothetical protein
VPGGTPLAMPQYDPELVKRQTEAMGSRLEKAIPHIISCYVGPGAAGRRAMFECDPSLCVHPVAQPLIPASVSGLHGMC